MWLALTKPMEQYSMIHTQVVKNEKGTGKRRGGLEILEQHNTILHFRRADSFIYFPP
jgi:hypothetical protein